MGIEQAVEHHGAVAGHGEREGAGRAAGRGARQAQRGAGVEPHRAADRGEGDRARVAVLGDVEEALLEARDVDRRAFAQPQVAAGRGHVDRAAAREHLRRQVDAAAGQREARALAIGRVGLGRGALAARERQQAGGAQGLRRRSARRQQRRGEPDVGRAGIERAAAFAEDAPRGGQFQLAEALHRLVARAQHQLVGADRQRAGAHRQRGGIGHRRHAVLQGQALGAQHHARVAVARQRGRVERHVAEAGAAEVDVAMEIHAGVAAQPQPLGIRELGQRALVEHQPLAAAAEAHAAAAQGDAAARDLRRRGEGGAARGVDGQRGAALQHRAFLDQRAAAFAQVHALAQHARVARVRQPDQRAPVARLRGQHVVERVLGVDHAVVVVVEPAVGVGVDRLGLRRDHQAAGAGRAAARREHAVRLDRDLAARREDQFGARQRRLPVVAHHDVAGRDLDAHAQRVAGAHAADQQAGRAGVRQRGRVDHQVALGAQRAAVLARAHHGDLLRRDVQHAAAPAGRRLHVEAAVELERVGGAQHQRAGIHRQPRDRDVGAGAAVLREPEGIGREELAGQRLVVFAVAAQRLARQHAPGGVADLARAGQPIAPVARDHHRAVGHGHGAGRAGRGHAAAGHDREGTRQRRIARGQHGIPAGLQALAAREPDAFAHRGARRHGGPARGQDREHAGHGEQVVRAAGAGHELARMQVAAAGHVDHRARRQFHARCIERDALLGRCV